MKEQLLHPNNNILDKLEKILNILNNIGSQKDNSKNISDIIDREELANRLGVSTRTIINLEKRNQFKSIKIGRLRKYVFSEVLHSLKKENLLHKM